MKYDIIGDIHGHADELESLLQQLGYRKDQQGTYQPPEKDRQAIFVGDFVDRGPGQFRSIEIARHMVESGSAQAVMGNHELNASLYHTHVERGGELIPLRPHSEKNTRQHTAFLRELHANSLQGRKHIEWMKSLPLYLDLGPVKVVHAVWDEQAMELLKKENVLDEHNRIRPDKWEQVADYEAPVGNAVEILTKGLEIALPKGVTYKDPEGTVRDVARIKWWADISNPQASYPDVLLNVPEGEIAQTPIPADIRRNIERVQPKEKNTVFFGHYWQQGERPAVELPNAICLDQSVAKNGHLAAATVTVDRDKVTDIAFASVKAIPHEHHAAVHRQAHKR